MSNTTAPKNGAGELKRKGAALRARAAAEQQAAKAKFEAGLPNAKVAPTKPASVAAVAPQQPTPVATATPPPAPAAASTADPEGAALLAQLAALSGVEYIQFFHQREKEIRAARAGVPLDAGKFPNLRGLDRVAANVRLPKP